MIYGRPAFFAIPVIPTIDYAVFQCNIIKLPADLLVLQYGDYVLHLWR